MLQAAHAVPRGDVARRGRCRVRYGTILPRPHRQGPRHGITARVERPEARTVTQRAREHFLLPRISGNL